jgi:hypothetical protein
MRRGGRINGRGRGGREKMGNEMRRIEEDRKEGGRGRKRRWRGKETG